MFKSLRKVLTLALAAGMIFTACNSNAGVEEASVPTETRSSSIESTNTVRIYSSLNPGYGYAVYFTGSFDAANSWTTAIRGTYDNGWYLDVAASSSFEWKALTGSYSCGETTSVNNLTWESGDNHVYTIENPDTCNLYVLTAPGYAHYGQTCYFTGTFEGADNWSTAVHNDGFSWNTYKWFKIIEADGDFEWKSLKGFGDHGDTYAAPFDGLTWSDGANYTKADALTFAEFWADYAQLSFAFNSYDYKTKTVTLNSGDLYGVYADYQDTAATIVEILKGDEVVYSAAHDFTTDGSMTIDVSFIDDKDDTIYTLAVSPVSIYGDKGKAYNTKFSVGMCLVNGGYNTIGCDTDDDEENVEHTVVLTSYWISRYEVTDKEFQAVFGQSSQLLTYKYYGFDEEGPALCMNYYWAITYCNKRSIAEGLTPVYTVEGVDFEDLTFSDIRYLSTEKRALFDAAVVDTTANGYRLPTEAEWEVAARGGENYKYSGSDTIDDVAVTYGTRMYRAAVVGSLAPNAFGIYDMSGNAEELCEDWYEAFTADQANYPKGPSTGTYKVVRGGGFSNYGDENYTVYNRYKMTPGNYSLSTGFRVVRNFQ